MLTRQREDALLSGGSCIGKSSQGEGNFSVNTVKNPAMSAHADAVQDRFAFKIAASLNERALSISPDIGERLRFAREQALGHVRPVRIELLAASNTTAILGGEGSQSGIGWWVKLASVLPLIMLVTGLLVIEELQSDAQISMAADVDASLLADDLPPAAYSDAGFVEFLKQPRD